MAHRTQSIVLLSNQQFPGVSPWFDGVTFDGDPNVPLTDADLTSARWTACEKAIAFLNAEQMKYTPADDKGRREERREPAPSKPPRFSGPPIIGATPEETAALEETAKRLADANRQVMEGNGGEAV